MLANMTDYRSPEAQRIMMGELTNSDILHAIYILRYMK